jgi:hypothetical protein
MTVRLCSSAWRVTLLCATLAIGIPLEILDVDDTREEEVFSESLAALETPPLTIDCFEDASLRGAISRRVDRLSQPRLLAIPLPRIVPRRPGGPLPAPLRPRAHPGKLMVRPDAPPPDLSRICIV